MLQQLCNSERLRVQPDRRLRLRRDTAPTVWAALRHLRFEPTLTWLVMFPRAICSAFNRGTSIRLDVV